MPSCSIEYQHGVSSLCDVARDFLEVELHGLGVCEGQREGGADAARGTDSAEQIGARVALIGGLAGPGSGQRPLPDQTVLLPDPSFVLEPDFERRRRRQAAEMMAERAREVFLKAATISSSCSGWRGRALMWENPSFFRSVPT